MNEFERAHSKLRYRKEGGGTQRMPRVLKAWKCACGCENPRYRAQCGDCMSPRTQEGTDDGDYKPSGWPGH